MLRTYIVYINKLQTLAYNLYRFIVCEFSIISHVLVAKQPVVRRYVVLLDY